MRFRPFCFVDTNQIHVAAQEEAVGKASDDAERRHPFECVAHGSDAVVKLKFVKVTQPFEGTLNHLVIETAGRSSAVIRATKRCLTPKWRPSKATRSPSSSNPSVRPGGTTRSAENAADSLWAPTSRARSKQSSIGRAILVSMTMKSWSPRRLYRYCRNVRQITIAWTCAQPGRVGD